MGLAPEKAVFVSEFYMMCLLTIQVTQWLMVGVSLALIAVRTTHRFKQRGHLLLSDYLIWISWILFAAFVSLAMAVWMMQGINVPDNEMTELTLKVSSWSRVLARF